MNKLEIISILKNVIDNYLCGIFDKKQASMELIKNIDPEVIYNFDDEPMLIDCYFAIKHLVEIGYETKKLEIIYFQECLSGLRKYNLEDKTVFILSNNYKNYKE